MRGIAFPKMALMMTLILPVSARAQLSPADKISQGEALADRWQEIQVEAARMDTEFRANLRRDNPDQAEYVLKEIDGDWAYRQKLVRHLQDWRGSLVGRYRARAVAGVMTSSEAQRRVEYIDRLFRLRMLQIYGNLTPLAFIGVVDSSGKAVGRQWIGPSWRVVIELSDIHQIYSALIAQSGFLADDVVDDP